MLYKCIYIMQMSLAGVSEMLIFSLSAPVGPQARPVLSPVWPSHPLREDPFVPVPYRFPDPIPHLLKQKGTKICFIRKLFG